MPDEGGGGVTRRVIIAPAVVDGERDHGARAGAVVEKHSATSASRAQRVPHPRVHALILSQARSIACFECACHVQTNVLCAAYCCLHDVRYTCGYGGTRRATTRQRYIASKHSTCKHTSKRSISRYLATVLITVQLVSDRDLL